MVMQVVIDQKLQPKHPSEQRLLLHEYRHNRDAFCQESLMTNHQFYIRHAHMGCL